MCRLSAPHAPLNTICAALMLMLVLDARLCAAEFVDYADVVDGDTIRLNGTRIRLEGIDAPEIDQICLNSKAQRWTCGIEACDQLKRYADGKRWICKGDHTDRYGRVLASCNVEGTDIQRWLVQNGWALSFTRYSHEYDAEQDAARAAKAGLWSGAFIAPWDWRHRARDAERSEAFLLAVCTNVNGSVASNSIRT
jgi:endonuclease YncB( thermonuclease family)